VANSNSPNERAAARKGVLTERSNKILGAIDELRRLEEQKRQEPISTPDFHELAKEIEEKSRQVFRIAADQRKLGEAIPTGDDSIDDVEDDTGT
jgi:hypothetical protein